MFITAESSLTSLQEIQLRVEHLLVKLTDHTPMVIKVALPLAQILLQTLHHLPLSLLHRLLTGHSLHFHLVLGTHLQQRIRTSL